MSAPKYSNWCPKCGASPFMPCRSLTTGKITDTHAARINAKARPS